MDNQNYEQEIDLKDLMFAVFHKWRSIILTAVILGILLGGYKLGTGLMNREANGDIQTVQADFAEDVDLFERTNRMYELEIGLLKERVEAQEDYFTNSVLMQLNPYSKNVASAGVFIKTDLLDRMNGTYVLMSDDADGILKAYEQVIKRAEGIERISGTAIEPRYLMELITTSVDYAGNMLNVTVAYKEEAGAQEILEMLLSNLKKEYTEIQSKFGNHELIFMDETSGIITDPGLVNTQRNYSDSLSNLQKSLADKEKALEDLTPPSQPSALSAVSSLKSGIKYGILGGVLGAFLSVFCICVAFLMSDKMSSEKELKSRFGLRILGVFAQISKKRPLSGVDRWLDRMEGKTSRKPAEVYEIMAVNVKNYMEEGQKILILGSASNGKISEIAEELRRRVPGAEIQVGQDMEQYAETLRLLPEAGQVILVEERGKSKYEEIQNQVEVIRSLNKDIIGCVVV